MSYTEFINALDVLNGHPHLTRKLAFLPEERPVVFQIFDSEPMRLLETALRLLAYEPDIIDVNMGCSVRCVSGRGAGAGLLREPEKIGRIFTLLTRALPVPVTGKIRLGWDEQARNYIDIARVVEENGGALLAVHGRTRSQGYSAPADWDAIAEIQQAVSIPVIANGDVRSVADIERIKAQTGCQGVMIGRAAIGNPWIFSRLDRSDVPLEMVRETLLRHLERMLAFYGPELGLVRFRKHASRYLAAFELTPEQRHSLLTAQGPVEFLHKFTSLNA
jgi:nifR3 family TIM-barrel protein